MLRTLSAGTLLTGLLLLPCGSEGGSGSGSGPGAPQERRDPLRLYPANYALLLENERVRVLDFRLERGATEELHEHPAHVAHVLQGFRIRFTFPDGRTAIREAKTGDVLFSEAVAHASENIGDTDAHGLLIELKGEAGRVRQASVDADELLRPLTAFTFIHGLPGHEEELKQHLLSLTAPTRGEAGNLAYDLYQSRAEPQEFLRLERWRDEAALEAHKQTAPLKDSFARRQREGWTTEITLWDPVAPGPAR